MVVFDNEKVNPSKRMENRDATGKCPIVYSLLVWAFNPGILNPKELIIVQNPCRVVLKDGILKLKDPELVFFNSNPLGKALYPSAKIPI